MFSVVNVFFKVLMIKSFFSFGICFSSKKASNFRTTISPSVFPFSEEDFRSDFSSDATLPGMPRVAIIEAATRYTRSFRPILFRYHKYRGLIFEGWHRFLFHVVLLVYQFLLAKDVMFLLCQ